MFAIWRGFGWLVLLAATIGYALTQFGVDTAMGEQGYYTANAWPKYLAAVAAAVCAAIAGSLLNSHKPNHHTLFFIPVQYWSIITLLFGLYGAYALARG